MAGIPMRDRKNPRAKSERKEVTYEEIKAKLYKKPLTVKEIAKYLSENNPNAPTTDKTIKNHIADICKKSDGLLCEDDFKKDRKFFFEPRYHGLLLSLLDTTLFDDRKNDRKLVTKRKINAQVARNIDKYLEDDDKSLIKETPMYLTARIEDEIFNRINMETSAILRSLYHTDSAVRWKSLLEYLEAVKKLRRSVQRRESDTMAKRLVYAHSFEEREDALWQKGLFEAETLENLIIKLLAYRVNGKFHDQNLSPEDMFPALFLVKKLFRYSGFTEESVEKILADVDDHVKNSKRYKTVDDKARKILDLEDPYERNIYDMLMFYTNISFLMKYTEAKDYQNMERYMESVVKYDIWDILNLFVNYGRKDYTPEELELIRKCQSYRDD